MSASVHPLRPAALAPAQEPAARCEERRQSICRAEYSAYPRISSDPERHVGFTLDESASGLCLGVTRPEAVGSLLCVRRATIDGQAKDASMARVVWCQETSHPGHFRIGLSVVAEAGRKMLLVRPGQRRSRTLAESA